MSESNLGRVQGGGFYGSTSTSATSILKTTVQTNGVTPLIGDSIINANGDLCKITAITSSAYTVTKYGSIKGAQGDKGADGKDGGATISPEDTAVLQEGEIGYKDGVTKIGDGKTPWNDLPAFATTRFTFASAGWGDIARIAAAGEASKYFHVGDEKTITLSTGEEVTLVILGFDHDDLTAGGKAPITIGMKNCLATRYPMNGSGTNASGWDGSVMRKQTMARLLTQLPEDLQGVIKAVNKKTTMGKKLTTITTSSDKLFLFSAIEIGGKNYPPANLAGCADEGEQYEYWRTIKDGAGKGSGENPDCIKRLSNGKGAVADWALRSPDPSNYTSFLIVIASGSINTGTAGYAFGVSFGFCI